jgi:hypothetical protein
MPAASRLLTMTMAGRFPATVTADAIQGRNAITSPDSLALQASAAAAEEAVAFL